ncbi:dTDP-4-dehydrorhamnose 3,5-epimerase [Pseudomarimonas salicorniae]|uniref:dTDP-4-dehydrorhamnose 3,5-epimerase n=1 Tax=Pseudomarimonas salicorniae TaxID=2933270 RepID=A0ABT0GJ27_9GAMM|nr:dTDP-4-dehydrorhamnose 3,5-epimerase [Lysobacter sp. CAU 1642]MCK7594027.1 dTDP-4-dehydrorhamnose 3,5-epimerase [Lysobacter sp. CAU 1642]
MKVTETRLPGCLIIEPKVFGDARGFFMEQWNAARYAEHGIVMDAVQANLSRSAHGVLRGLHYQLPNPQGKLVSVLEGEVYDVAVDIRRDSPTFGQWTAAVLSAENRRQFWIPPGFAHGFVVTSDFALFHYFCSTLYDGPADKGIAWNDPDLAIDWPVKTPSLSAKDQVAPRLKDVDPQHLPAFAA